MSKSKSDFISDILSMKGLTLQNKKRVLALVTNENEFTDLKNSELLTKLELIKQQVNKPLQPQKNERLKAVNPANNLSKEIQSEHRSDGLPNYINPRNISRYLNKLNQDIILKTTTHAIDENLLQSLLMEMKIEHYDYVTHLNHIKKKFNYLEAAFKADLPKGLMAKLRAFYFGEIKKGWSQDKIKIGWSAEEIKVWCKKNREKCPNPDRDLDHSECELNTPVALTSGKKLGTFTEVINHFKLQIECRDDSYLENVLLTVNKENFQGINIDMKNIAPMTRFYSDVEKIQQAYKSIMYTCIKYHENRYGNTQNMQVEVRLNRTRKENEDIVILGIFHKNVRFGKDINNLYDRYGTDFTGLIQNQINGLCELELCADFPNNSSHKISIWPRSNDINHTEIGVLGGVVYNLIFYITQ